MNINSAQSNGPYDALENSYFVFLEGKPPNNPTIRKYLFDNLGEENQDSERLNAAAAAIKKFLDDNQTFCPTFVVDFVTLREKIEKNRYLTINGLTISLADELEAPLNCSSEFKDFFSETLLEDPVTCTKGKHHFEKDRLVIWIREKSQKERTHYNSRQNDYCPAGSTRHLIGEIKTDEDLKEAIDEFKNKKKQEDDEHTKLANQAIKATFDRFFRNYSDYLKNKEINIKNENHDIEKENHEQKGELQLQQSQRSVNSVTTGAGLAKVLVKLGARQFSVNVSRNFAKQATRYAVKQAGINTLKQVPLLGLIISLPCALYRFKKGQSRRAVGEIVGGLCSTIPGPGTVASLAIDGTLAICDIAEACTSSQSINEKTDNEKTDNEKTDNEKTDNEKTDNENLPEEGSSSHITEEGSSNHVIEINLGDAYKILGLEKVDPSQKEVDRAYQDQLTAIQLVAAIQPGDFSEEDIRNLIGFLNEIKEFIYNEREWLPHGKKRPRESD